MQKYNITKENKYQHFSKDERKILERLLNQKKSLKEIGSILNKSRSTIWRELKRKENYESILKWNNPYKKYIAEIAQENYEDRRTACGRKYEFFKCKKFIETVEDLVLNKHYSPEQAIGRIEYLQLPIEKVVSLRTIYNYIELSLIKIKRKHLRFKERRKRKHKIIRKNKRILGKSIELRPESVNKRIEFGHFETDLIVDRFKNCVLVMQERKTRNFYLIKCQNSKADEINFKINEKLKELRNIIKTLTTDNGTEFSKLTNLENENLKIYFTHPYSSYEKGGIENLNSLIRRFIPKGSNLKNLQQEFLNKIQDFINNLPRKILGFRTANEIWQEQLTQIA